MVTIENEIERLLEKRENLLKDKESNRLQIWICEQEIFTYTHLYDTLSELMLIKRKNIESYLSLIDYRRSSKTFTWPGLTSGYGHILPMIDHLQEEYDEMNIQAEKSEKMIKLYTSKKEALCVLNEEADAEIDDIESKLGINQGRVKKIEIGE